MYKFLLLTACIVYAFADQDVTLERFATQVNTDGTYAYNIAQSDGTEIAEEGVGNQYAKGQFKYYSPEGLPVSVTYVADENGFQPQSEWIPTPPPIPDYILKAIRYIEEHPTPEELADREVRARQI